MKALLFANVGTDPKGYYHVGDEAMFQAIYDFYQAEFPNIQLSSLVSVPIFNNSTIIERRGLGWPNEKKAAMRYFFTCLLKTFIWVKFKKSFFTQEQKDFIDFIQQQDFIHFTGGGNLTSECGHWFYYALFVIGVAHLLKKPVILTSQTLGPFTTFLDREIAIKIINTTHSIQLREYSDLQEKRLRQFGLNSPNIMHALDAAYFLQPAQNAKLPMPAQSVIRIGLSLHSRKNNTQQLKNIVNQAISSLANHHQSLEIVFLPHILNRFDEWDTEFLETITKSLPSSIKIIKPTFHSLVTDLTKLAPYIKALTSTCDAVISSRYHGVIFALSQSVPCITIVDGEYQKMKNFEAMKFVFGESAQKYVFSMGQSQLSEKFSRAVIDLVDTQNAVREQIKKRNLLLKDEYQKYLQHLKKEISALKSN